MRIAIMFACYNRKELTKRCLNSLRDQFQEISDQQFDVYAYDDCSTDGTYEMLIEDFPQITVVRGNGNAYWCRSMYYLMKMTVEKKYDFYMMINDDVFFYADAIKQMFDSYNEAGRSCGIVGTFKSAYSQKITYGGRNQQLELLPPNGQIQQCVWANWNCFLIDENVVEKVGIIDGKYCHSWGDWDYAHRMIKKGFTIYETANYIGECEVNSKENTYKDNTLKRGIRLKKLISPKGLPFASFMRYNIKIKGILGLFISIYGYCSIIGYIIMGRELY